MTAHNGNVSAAKMLFSLTGTAVNCGRARDANRTGRAAGDRPQHGAGVE
jgi:hypothetical protein